MASCCWFVPSRCCSIKLLPPPAGLSILPALSASHPCVAGREGQLGGPWLWLGLNQDMTSSCRKLGCFCDTVVILTAALQQRFLATWILPSGFPSPAGQGNHGFAALIPPGPQLAAPLEQAKLAEGFAGAQAPVTRRLCLIFSVSSFLSQYFFMQDDSCLMKALSLEKSLQGEEGKLNLLLVEAESNLVLPWY